MNSLSSGRLSGLGLDLLLYLRPIAVAVVVWEVAVTLGLIPTQTLPHTYTVLATLVELASEGPLLSEGGLTFARAISAYLLGSAIAVVLGLLMVRFAAVQWFFDPLISIGFPIPFVTLVPVFILWFGFGSLPIVLLAAIHAFFPVTIGTFRAGKSVNRELLWSARSMGVSRLAVIWKVILPASLPGIFNGMQISLFLTFGVTVAAEMLMSGGGLGELIIEAVRFFRPAEAISGLIVVALLGIFMDYIFTSLRSRYLDWQEVNVNR